MTGTGPVPIMNDDRQRTLLLDDLARRYSVSLRRFFSRKVADRVDVADLVQEVFLRLARLRNLASIEQPEHYLFAAASSALKDRIRRNSVRGVSAATDYDDALHGRSEITPERVLAGKRTVARMEAVLLELPERTRDIFILRMLENHKMADIARALGISQRAVEKHLAKAMLLVRTRLREDLRD